MENLGSLENHASAWGLANFLTIQMTLRAAVELNVFNIIAKSGPGAHLTSKEIVSQIPNTNPTLAGENLERILKLLSVHSLLSTFVTPNPIDKKKETRYGLTKEALCLVQNEDGVSFSPVVAFGSEMFVAQSFYMLKYKVLEPESSPFLKAHGESFYDYMSNKPELCQLFDKVMGLNSYLYFDHKVFEVYKGFEEVKELMDVGGGDGTTIAKIVSRYPHIHGINFNLPSVISKAPKLPGVKHVSGDMFELIPETQSLMLMLVLHNWDDEHCKKILRNCWEAIPDYGKVIVIEQYVMPELVENTPEMKRILYYDVIMMTLFPGGKERTIAEFDILAKSVGFVETKIFPLPRGSYVIEFLKGGSVGSLDK
ncbi:(S)-scoulerine 9-O-methyltransferase-like isoform X1 [Rosa rugosa]|uniref:(S)-scoulerine 9-O-methyltransferase-like isoform X1 n=1 Tax=Rosa rugosa TaxID=74645 RepID=UPI002B403191|nr:(S)-scoulerine 9-O-methyltransferase-like isoform X1 [Rosa rugosa]